MYPQIGTVPSKAGQGVKVIANKIGRKEKEKLEKDPVRIYGLNKKNSSVATAHEVEVNGSFSGIDRPENMVKGTQKMFTPQLYEQLPSVLNLN
jgi:hypothetical protein